MEPEWTKQKDQLGGGPLVPCPLKRTGAPWKKKGRRFTDVLRRKVGLEGSEDQCGFKSHLHHYLLCQCGREWSPNLPKSSFLVCPQASCPFWTIHLTITESGGLANFNNSWLEWAGPRTSEGKFPESREHVCFVHSRIPEQSRVPEENPAQQACVLNQGLKELLVWTS